MAIGKLNILTSSRFHDMFEGWTSISFAWQIPLSKFKDRACPWPLHTRFTRCNSTGRNKNMYYFPHMYILTMWLCKMNMIWTSICTSSTLWQWNLSGKTARDWLKLTYSSNMSWHLLLAEIFNSPIFAEMYHGQHVTTSVLLDANRLALQIRARGRYAALL